jgi:UDP-glucose 4-epimerase
MILVVGGAGYIGSHMLKLLREAKEPHVVFDNLENGHREALGGSSLFEGDLRNLPNLDECFGRNPGIDVVIDFASYISVGESVREPNKYYRNNVGGTLNLLESMRRHGIESLVFSSTAALYGNPSYTPIDEAHPLAPINPYGWSKYMSERLIEDFGTAYGLRSVCLRYFNAAGSDPDGVLGEDHDPEEHLIPNVLLAAIGKKPALKVFGDDYDTVDGTCVRDYIHVEDLASAHLLAVRHLRSGASSRKYNLGNGRGFSVRQVLESAERVVGRAIPYEVAPRRAGDSPTLVADSSRIAADWGWQPKHRELDEIVRHAWNWRQSHPDGFDDSSTLAEN